MNLAFIVPHSIERGGYTAFKALNATANTSMGPRSMECGTPTNTSNRGQGINTLFDEEFKRGFYSLKKYSVRRKFFSVKGISAELSARLRLLGNPWARYYYEPESDIESREASLSGETEGTSQEKRTSILQNQPKEMDLQ